MAARTPVGASGLRARRVELDYLVARDHPAPLPLRAKLDQELRRDLAPALERALGSLFDPADDSIWLIRRLTLDLTVNVGWSGPALAQAVARAFAVALDRAIRSGGDGVNVIRYRDPVDRMARFVTELAVGNPWSHWYHREFAGLKALPRSSALRTALLQGPAIALKVLAVLPARSRSSVLDALSHQDASRLAGEAAIDTDEPPAHAIADAIAGVVENIERVPSDSGTEELAALGLLIGLAAAGMSPGPQSLALCRATARLMRLQGEGGGLGRVRRVFPEGRAVAPHELGADDAGRLIPIARLPVPVALRLLDSLERGPGGPRGPELLNADRQEGTSHGGVFLLIPLLAEVRWDDACRGWPDCDGLPAAMIVRMLVLAKALEGHRAQHLLRDPVVRKVVGLSREPPTHAMRGWLSDVPSRAVLGFLESVREQGRLRGDIGDAHATMLRAKTAEGTVIGLVDESRGHWLCINCPPELLATRPAKIRREGGALLEDAGEGPATREQAFADDLRTLAFTPALRGPPRVDFALAVAAQNILRRFAWKLPGFARASHRHLASNLLSGGATLDSTGDTWVARIERPPLGVLLDLTGLTRTTCVVPWLGNRRLALFPETGR